jgi:hypothetical protein
MKIEATPKCKGLRKKLWWKKRTPKCMGLKKKTSNEKRGNPKTRSFTKPKNKQNC